MLDSKVITHGLVPLMSHSVADKKKNSRIRDNGCSYSSPLNMPDFLEQLCLARIPFVLGYVRPCNPSSTRPETN